MPMSEPENVSISPKAINSEWCISPIGGQRKPHASNTQPNPHRLTAKSNCTFFMIAFVFHSHGSYGLPRIIRITKKISANQCYQWEWKNIILLSIQEFLFADVKHKCAKGLVLRLFSKCRLVARHESWIFQSFAGHLSDLRKLGTPCLFFLRYCGGAFACHAATALAFARQAAHCHPFLFLSKDLARCIIHGR